MKRFLTFGAILMFSHASFAAIHRTVCFPQTVLNYPRSLDLKADAMAKSTFDAAIDKVYNHYAPIVQSLGYTLQFNRYWDDSTVNSDTYVDGNTWVIESFGGLARSPGMNTEAAYAEVSCHELGHHMGGAPLFDNDVMSVEGEADYWATKNCMKAIGYSDQEIAAASQALSNVLAQLDGDPMPSPSTPDTDVVETTYQDHPIAQCRLDTYLSGLECQAEGLMSQTDPKVNSCYSYPTGATYGQGSRPRCWFEP